SGTLDLGALHVSPLQRAQETATPVSQRHKIAITTDPQLIEAGNKFEGKKFDIGIGALRHPSAWRHLWNPWRPSWGEPYVEIVERMKNAIFAAHTAANGKDALCVSHQLPIWIFRSFIEGRSFLHDPRKRECTLASVTSFHIDDQGIITGFTYQEPAAHLLP
ncbi:MAG: histidine phosphatase family protein, partial [Actinobacteria bacterium]|nr:histidine phosphatase family protein [Actinomycetota bacterium]